MGPESGASNYLSGAKVHWEWKLQCQAKRSLPKISIPHPPLPIEKEYSRKRSGIWKQAIPSSSTISSPSLVFFPSFSFDSYLPPTSSPTSSTCTKQTLLFHRKSLSACLHFVFLYVQSFPWIHGFMMMSTRSKKGLETREKGFQCVISNQSTICNSPDLFCFVFFPFKTFFLLPHFAFNSIHLSYKAY